MANITIPKRIRQAFINSLFKYDKDSRTNLDWNWNLKKKGRKVCDYIFIDKTFPVDSIHPVNEEGKQFAPFITVKECVPVSWDNGKETFLSKDNERISYDLSCIGYSSISSLKKDFGYDKKQVITGYLLRLFDDVSYEPTVNAKRAKKTGGAMRSRKLTERYQIIADIENGFFGDRVDMLRQQSEALNDRGFLRFSGQQYDAAAIRAMRRTKPYKSLITNPAVFNEYRPNDQRASMHYYPHVTEIYETMRIMSDQPPRKIVAELTKKGIQYKKEEDFTSAVIDTFRGHVAYKRYLKQFDN